MKIARHFATLALPLSLALALTPAVRAEQPAAQPENQGTSSTVKDTLFQGTEKFSKDASEVTEISQDDSDLNRVGGRNSNRARGMVLNVVRTYEYDKPGMYNMKDVEEIRNRLNTGEWHCSVHTRDYKHGESTDICNRARTDGMVESAIITVEPKELTFIHTIKRAGSEGDGNFNIRIVPPTPPTPPSPGASLGPGLSGLHAGLNAGFDAELNARLGSLKGLEARLGGSAMSRWETQAPILEARGAEMEAMQPLMEARMAGMQARIAAQQARLGAQMQEWEAGVPTQFGRVYTFHSSHASSGGGSSSQSSSSSNSSGSTSSTQQK